MIGCIFYHRVADAYSANMFFCVMGRNGSVQIFIRATLISAVNALPSPSWWLWWSSQCDTYIIPNLKLTPPEQETNSIHPS